MLVACQIDRENSCKDRFVGTCGTLISFAWECVYLKSVCRDKLCEGEKGWFFSYCNWILWPFFHFHSFTQLSLLFRFDCLYFIEELPLWLAGLFRGRIVLGMVGTAPPPPWAWNKRRLQGCAFKAPHCLPSLSKEVVRKLCPQVESVWEVPP